MPTKATPTARRRKTWVTAKVRSKVAKDEEGGPERFAIGLFEAETGRARVGRVHGEQFAFPCQGRYEHPPGRAGAAHALDLAQLLPKAIRQGGLWRAAVEGAVM